MKNDHNQVHFSIVLICYNTVTAGRSRTLRRAVESVLSQNYGACELIIVNDGSSDETPSLCKDIAKSDERIRLITQTNQGPGAARNNGVAHANGEYVLFLDDDDYWCDLNFLRNIGSILLTHKVDVLCYGIIARNKFRDTRLGKQIAIEPFSSDTAPEDYIMDLIISGNFGYPAWNKAVRTDFLRAFSIQTPPKLNFDDYFYSSQLVRYARSFAFYQNPVIVFDRVQSTISKGTTYEKLESAVQAFENQQNEYRIDSDALSNSALRLFSRSGYVSILSVAQSLPKLERRRLTGRLSQYKYLLSSPGHLLRANLSYIAVIGRGKFYALVKKNTTIRQIFEFLDRFDLKNKINRIGRFAT